jgi:hypothetical protein
MPEITGLPPTLFCDRVIGGNDSATNRAKSKVFLIIEFILKTINK